MTFALSRLTVFATTPPQPASKDLAMTRAFVPGGPEPSRKGLGNLMPLTVIERFITHLSIADFGLQNADWKTNSRELFLNPQSEIRIPQSFQSATSSSYVSGLRSRKNCQVLRTSRIRSRSKSATTRAS